jgi:ATP-dependent Clp protease ATP-binding subunit ClpA
VPKINVYLSDDLAAAVREAGISVSPVCQQALAEAVRAVRASREASNAIRAPGFDPGQQPDISRHVSQHMTPRLRRVIRRAHELVEPPGAVGTEDLLLGVLDEPGNLGLVVLQSLGVDPTALRDEALRAVESSGRTSKGSPEGAAASEVSDAKPADADGPSPGDRAQLAEELLERLSFAARLVVASAIDVAGDLGHEFLGCEHLVAALCDDDEGVAGPLMRAHGITASACIQAIPAALAGAALGFRQSGGTSGPALSEQLEEIVRRLDGFDERLRAGGL